MNKICDFYNENAASYSTQSLGLIPLNAWNAFESYIVQNAHILDAGCGVGRDSKHFMDKGYKVTYMDGSIAMVRQAEQTTGHKVIHCLFDDIDEIGRYDAIWCYASLLHVHKHKLDETLSRIQIALKNKGVLFMCFKHGEWDGLDAHKRYYYDLNDARFSALELDSKGWKIERKCLEPCPLLALPKRPDWYSVILRKE
jgi:SAM-dependent methyltransferase